MSCRETGIKQHDRQHLFENLVWNDGSSTNRSEYSSRAFDSHRKSLIKMSNPIDISNEERLKQQKGVVNMFFSAIKQYQVEVVESMLREYQVRGDEKGEKDNTALHFCFQSFGKDTNRSAQIAKLLLEFHAKPNAKNEEGWCPLHLAAMKGSLGAMRFALSHNLSQIDSKGSKRLFDFKKKGGAQKWGIIHIAANIGHVSMLEFLFNLDYDMTTLNILGQTAKAVAIHSLILHKFLTKYENVWLHLTFFNDSDDGSIQATREKKNKSLHENKSNVHDLKNLINQSQQRNGSTFKKSFLNSSGFSSLLELENQNPFPGQGRMNDNPFSNNPSFISSPNNQSSRLLSSPTFHLQSNNQTPNQQIYNGQNLISDTMQTSFKNTLGNYKVHQFDISGISGKSRQTGKPMISGRDDQEQNAADMVQPENTQEDLDDCPKAELQGQKKETEVGDLDYDECSNEEQKSNTNRLIEQFSSFISSTSQMVNHSRKKGDWNLFALRKKRDLSIAQQLTSDQFMTEITHTHSLIIKLASPSCFEFPSYSPYNTPSTNNSQLIGNDNISRQPSNIPSSQRSSPVSSNRNDFSEQNQTRGSRLTEILRLLNYLHLIHLKLVHMHNIKFNSDALPTQIYVLSEFLAFPYSQLSPLELSRKNSRIVPTLLLNIFDHFIDLLNSENVISAPSFDSCPGERSAMTKLESYRCNYQKQQEFYQEQILHNLKTDNMSSSNRAGTPKVNKSETPREMEGQQICLTSRITKPRHLQINLSSLCQQPEKQICMVKKNDDSPSQSSQSNSDRDEQTFLLVPLEQNEIQQCILRVLRMFELCGMKDIKKQLLKSLKTPVKSWSQYFIPKQALIVKDRSRSRSPFSAAPFDDHSSNISSKENKGILSTFFSAPSPNIKEQFISCHKEDHYSEKLLMDFESIQTHQFLQTEFVYNQKNIPRKASMHAAVHTVKLNLTPNKQRPQQYEDDGDLFEKKNLEVSPLDSSQDKLQAKKIKDLSRISEKEIPNISTLNQKTCSTFSSLLREQQIAKHSNTPRSRQRTSNLKIDTSFSQITPTPLQQESSKSSKSTSPMLYHQPLLQESHSTIPLLEQASSTSSTTRNIALLKIQQSSGNISSQNQSNALFVFPSPRNPSPNISRNVSPNTARDVTMNISKNTTPRRKIDDSIRSEVSPNRKTEVNPNRKSEVNPTRKIEVNPNRKIEVNLTTMSEVSPTSTSEVSPNITKNLGITMMKKNDITYAGSIEMNFPQQKLKVLPRLPNSNQSQNILINQIQNNIQNCQFTSIQNVQQSAAHLPQNPNPIQYSNSQQNYNSSMKNEALFGNQNIAPIKSQNIQAQQQTELNQNYSQIIYQNNRNPSQLFREDPIELTPRNHNNSNQQWNQPQSIAKANEANLISTKSFREELINKSLIGGGQQNGQYAGSSNRLSNVATPFKIQNPKTVVSNLLLEQKNINNDISAHKLRQPNSFSQLNFQEKKQNSLIIKDIKQISKEQKPIKNREFEIQNITDSNKLANQFMGLEQTSTFSTHTHENSSSRSVSPFLPILNVGNDVNSDGHAKGISSYQPPSDIAFYSRQTFANNANSNSKFNFASMYNNGPNVPRTINLNNCHDTNINAHLISERSSKVANIRESRHSNSNNNQYQQMSSTAKRSTRQSTLMGEENISEDEDNKNILEDNPIDKYCKSTDISSPFTMKNSFKKYQLK